MSKNDGGPAFPAVYQGDTRSDCPGLSMRDYFAAKAMQGFCTQPPDQFEDLRQVAEQSYNLADAMLAEREREQ